MTSNNNAAPIFVEFTISYIFYILDAESKWQWGSGERSGREWIDLESNATLN